MGYASINPADGTRRHDFEEHGDGHIGSLRDRAHAAYARAWSPLGVDARRAVVKKAATLLRERREEMARSVTLEMGKLIVAARAEVDLSADILDYYADNAAAFLAVRPLRIATGEAYVESAPMGVLFCIEPWNFPYYQLARVAGPNLMAGNTLIVKHAPNVPLCALAFAKLFADAGTPIGVYANVFASNEQAARIIEDTRVIGVALTGGVRAGAAVASVAGRAVKKSTLELGGSDAFIVLDDADLDLAVAEGVSAKMNNTGECCIAARRYILHEKVADAFLARFKAELEKLKPGDAMDEATTLGPLCTERPVRRARPDQGRRRWRSQGSARWPPPRPPGLLPRADDHHGHDTRQPGLPRGTLRSRRDHLPCPGRGPRGSARERLAPRPRGNRDDAGCRAWEAHGASDRSRHGVRQQGDVDGAEPPVRRDQELWLRPRAGRGRYGRVRQQEARAHRLTRRRSVPAKSPAKPPTAELTKVSSIEKRITT